MQVTEESTVYIVVISISVTGRLTVHKWAVDEPMLYAGFTVESEADEWLKTTLAEIRSSSGAALLRLT